MLGVNSKYKYIPKAKPKKPVSTCCTHPCDPNSINANSDDEQYANGNF